MTAQTRLLWGLLALTALLSLVVLFALSSGFQSITWRELQTSETARTIFFRLRVPRVLLAILVGASLSVVGAALQALFRNPLAEPFTLGVSGGGALGASVAIALGFKLAFMTLAIAGLATLWMAVVADMGASLIVVANGLRLLRAR